MVFKCEKVEKIYFFVEAEDEEQAQEYIQTHGISEIIDEMQEQGNGKYLDCDDSERVLFPVNGDADIDLTMKKEE